MEWSVKSEQTPSSFWKVFLQIGDEKFDIAFLAINQKDAEEFKDHLVKALSYEFSFLWWISTNFTKLIYDIFKSSVLKSTIELMLKQEVYD